MDQQGLFNTIEAMKEQLKNNPGNIELSRRLEEFQVIHQICEMILKNTTPKDIFEFIWYNEFKMKRFLNESPVIKVFIVNALNDIRQFLPPQPREDFVHLISRLQG